MLRGGWGTHSPGRCPAIARVPPLRHGKETHPLPDVAHRCLHRRPGCYRFGHAQAAEERAYVLRPVALGYLHEVGGARCCGCGCNRCHGWGGGRGSSRDRDRPSRRGRGWTERCCADECEPGLGGRWFPRRRRPRYGGWDRDHHGRRRGSWSDGGVEWSGPGGGVQQGLRRTSEAGVCRVARPVFGAS